MSQTRVEKLKAMLQSQPGDPFLRYALAMEHIKAGQEDQAVADFLSILDDHPKYHAAYMQLAQIFEGQGDVEKACGFLEKGVAAAQANGDALDADEMLGMLDSLR